MLFKLCGIIALTITYAEAVKLQVQESAPQDDDLLSLEDEATLLSEAESDDAQQSSTAELIEYANEYIEEFPEDMKDDFIQMMLESDEAEMSQKYSKFVENVFKKVDNDKNGKITR